MNYTQLVDLHARYAECGLRILAFPCNQFGRQVCGSPLAMVLEGTKEGDKVWVCRV